MLVLLACAPSPPGTAGLASPTGATADTGGTTADTGCAPGPEIPLDGVDQACNGWWDEAGVGEDGFAAADLVYMGAEFEHLGEPVAVGTDASGTAWLLAGAIDGFRADAAPLDGAFDQVHGDGYFRFDSVAGVAVVDWARPWIVSFRGTTEAWPTDGGAPVTITDDDASLAAGDLDDDGADELVVAITGEVRVLGEDLVPRVTFVGAIGDPRNHVLGEAGDLTGDGIAEITIVADGRLWIAPGDATGTVPLEDVGWALAEEHDGDGAGRSAALGDANGDGHLDVLSGATEWEDRRGVAYLVTGPILADGSFAGAVARYEGLDVWDRAGGAVETLSDADGDGAAELVVAAGSNHSPGRIELHRGADAAGVHDAADAARVLVANQEDDRFGFALSADADLDGDGDLDLVVSGSGEAMGYVYDEGPEPAGGAVWVFLDPL